MGVEIPVATQIFVHSKDRENIFAITAATLDKLNLNIQDARLQSASDGTAFDVFYVLDEANQPVGSSSALSSKIINTLNEAIINPQNVDFDIQRRTPRQLKNCPKTVTPCAMTAPPAPQFRGGNPGSTRAAGSPGANFCPL